MVSPSDNIPRGSGFAPNGDPWLELEEAARLVPGGSYPLLRTWASDGVIGPDGKPLYLKSIRSSRIYTTQTWLNQFIDARSKPRPRRQASEPVRVPTLTTKVRVSHEEAERRLQAVGW